MTAQLLYTETQNFSSKWLRVLLLVINTFLLLTYLYTAVAKGENSDARTSLFISIAVMVLITLFLQRLRLLTEIRTNGIYVKFTILHSRFIVFEWTEVSRAYIRTYNALAEYGGWGLRHGLGNKMAFNTSGNKGIQLILKNGRTVLIGTQHPDEVALVLHRLGFGYGE